MNPPFSVIIMTTLIGMGQGLFSAVFIEQIYAIFAKNNGGSLLFYVVGSCLSLCLLGTGLLSSFFHLGHPERAWRSATCWRTSWLSREVIALPTFMLFVFIYMVLHFFPGMDVRLISGSLPLHLSVLIGLLGIVFAGVLFVCTGMIYACLKFLQEWHSPLTIINFTLMGVASGFILAMALASFILPESAVFFGKIAIFSTLLAATTRIISLIRNKNLRPRSTIQTALGINHPKIQQKAQGAMGGSFNTREFFHGQTKLFLRSIKWIFLVLAFLIPIILLSIQLHQVNRSIVILAVLIQYLGLVAERWYFFAEAKHPQNLYYQAIS